MRSQILHAASAYAILCSALLASARALLPTVDLFHDDTLHDNVVREGAASCGGITGLQQCGLDFPSSFCCPQETTCLQLNTTALITATLCCPQGSDCSIITPIPCDQESQNATLVPSSQYHSQPATKLTTCGSSTCCPQGFTCQGSYCAKITGNSAGQAASGSTTNTASASSETATSAIIVKPTTIPTTAAESSAVSAASSSPSSQFSASSFAAGFVPGIVLGAILIGLAIFFILRRRKQGASKPPSEKSFRSPRSDSLRNLHPDLSARPTFHGRTISEPTADLQYQAVRTAFYHPTPLTADGAPRPLFSRSSTHHADQAATYPSSPPGTTKRSSTATSSFKITPLRALRKQRSMHSLRRSANNIPSFLGGGHNTRTDSTETIRVLMHTPDRRPAVPHVAAHHYSSAAALTPAGGRNRDSWSSTSTSSPEADAYVNRMSHITNSDSPTIRTFPAPNFPPPSSSSASTSHNNAAHNTTTSSPFHTLTTTAATMNVPYTPSCYGPVVSGLFPPIMPIAEEGEEGGRRVNRDTTFSGMMARAGVGARGEEEVPEVPRVPENVAGLGRRRV